MSRTKKIKNNKNLMQISIIILILTVVIAIFSYAYARFVASRSGTVTAEIADVICEMTVETSNKSETILNPYCTITVKNTKLQGEGAEQTTVRSKSDLEFTIDVRAKDEKGVLPKFKWLDSNGNVLASSEDITDNGTLVARIGALPKQTMLHTQNEVQVFKIVFINDGDTTEQGEPLERLVDFNVVATQKKN